MAKRIRVVAAVIQHGTEYLITQRREDATLPLLWEFPGGRVESGEDDEAALEREFAERLGAGVEVGRPIAFRCHDYDGYTVELVLYEAQLDTDGLQAKRVNDFRWVAASDLSNYPFPPADQQTLEDFQRFVAKNKKAPMA